MPEYELDKDTIDYVKMMYTPGTRIKLIHMPDDPHPITPGDIGTVTNVDDSGTIKVNWDSGRSLGVVPGVDVFVVVSAAEVT